VLLIKVAEVWVAVGTVVVLQNLFLSCHWLWMKNWI